MKNFIRIPSLYLFASVFLTGCVSISTQKVKLETASALGNLECVPYARERSGISIYGDAYTWWTQARGRYRRSAQPASGSVMVLVDYAGPERGHLAVMSEV